MAAETSPRDGGRPAGNGSWIDHPHPVRRLVWALIVVSALLLASDLVVPRHGAFEIDHVFGFYAGFGLLASLAVVLVARLIRPLVMRREDYYGR